MGANGADAGAGCSNLGCGGLLTAANGDINVLVLSIDLNSSSDSVPGGGGLFISNCPVRSGDFSGILYPFSETKYSPVEKKNNYASLQCVQNTHASFNQTKFHFLLNFTRKNIIASTHVVEF